MIIAHIQHTLQHNTFFCNFHRICVCIPVNTDNGCKTCPERNGGGYGGNWDVSCPFETEDGGEIIDVLPLFAIACERQTSYHRLA